MKNIVLIGGGNIGKDKDYETKDIDKKIVSLTKKDNPTLLFIGLASSYSDSYYDIIKKNYKSLGCETLYLKRKNLINNKDIVKEKFSKADIIYIGGGDTIKLLKDIKEFNLEEELKTSYERGTVLVGISAGAILLSKEGLTDSYILRGESTHYKFIKGLNFVNISICPHFEKDINKEIELKNYLKKSKRKVYSLNDNTAIIIKDNKLETKKILSNKIYLCYYQNNNYIKEEI